MKFETISARELDSYINNRNYIIIDLREKEDYDRSHIVGALHMDFDELENGKVNLPQNKEIILYCERGGLSLMAAKKMSQMGYQVISVVGGIHAYRGKNLT